MANIWFISDTHFRHANFLTFKDAQGNQVRPFSSCQEMDECMVERWNENVRPSDHVYHLGDVSMLRPKYYRDILERLQGHKRLVRGNHDVYKTAEYWEWFDEIYGVRVLDNFLFTHIPVHPANLGRFKGNVHGHMHEKLVRTADGIPDPCYMNICVEQTQYRPIALEEIRQHFEKVSNA